jgi:hypothetical protein
MPHGWIILDKPLGEAVKIGIILIALALAGCGLLPRTSTSDEVMDAVLIRVDPFGDCVTVVEQTTIFKDTEGPNAPSVHLTAASFQDPNARVAAAAIAVSRQDYVWREEEQRHFGARNAQDCTMDLSAPAYSGNFAFINYSSSSGEIGVYVMQKIGARWIVNEQRTTGAW